MTLFKSLFGNKKFSPFFWVLFLGAFNDNVIKNILIILIAYKGVELFGLGPDSLVALVGALFILPYVIFSPYAGSLSDKFNKVKVIRGVKIIELLIMIVAGFGFYLQNYLVLIICIFLMGAQSTFFGPVKYSIPPELVPKKEISNATGYVEMGTFLAILLGTILGGYLSTIDSWALVGLILVFISILGILFSYVQPLTEVKENTKLKIGYNVFGGHISLFSLVSKQKLIILVTVLISMFWFLGAGLLTLLPSFCRSVLNVSEAVVTLFLAMFTVGIAFGSIVGAKLSNKKVEMALVPVGAIGVLLFTIDLFWLNHSSNAPETVRGISEYIAASSSKRTIFDFFGISFFGGLFILPLYAYLQAKAKKGTLSRVIAANNILNALFMVFVSLLIMIFVAKGLSPAMNLLIVAVIFFITAICLFFSVNDFRSAFLNYKFKK